MDKTSLGPSRGKGGESNTDSEAQKRPEVLEDQQRKMTKNALSVNENLRAQRSLPIEHVATCCAASSSSLLTSQQFLIVAPNCSVSFLFPAAHV